MTAHCPNCDAGQLVEMSHERVLTRPNDHVLYPAVYSKCDYCGIELVSADQSRRNLSAKREAEVAP